MNQSKNLAAFLFASCAAVTTFDAAHAQTASAGGAGSQITEVIVTARRRDERVQDVPISMAVLDTQTLADRGVTRLIDITQTVPGVIFSGDNYGKSIPNFVIRGQRSAAPTMTVDAPTTVYFAEVPNARSAGVNSSTMDLSSVQVLKGPQGTLFGKNNTGGAILLTPQAPTDRFEGYLLGRVGRLNERTVEGVVNVPINSTLAARFAVNVHRRDGYINNLNNNGVDLGNERWESYRGSLRWTPTETITNDLIFTAFHQDNAGVPNKTYEVNPTAAALPVATRTRLLAEYANLQTQPFWSSYSTVPAHGTRIMTTGLIDTLKIDTPLGTLKNIAGYRRVASRVIYTLDGSSLNLYYTRQDMTSHQLTDEVQLQGDTLDKKLEYTTGLFFFKEAGNDGRAGYLFGALAYPKGHMVNTSYAAYASASYHLLDNLTFTAGGRITRDKRQLDQTSIVFSAAAGGNVCRLLTADTGGVPLNPCFRALQATFTKPTYNLSLEWKMTPDALLYATQSRGYKSGGFDADGNAPGQNVPFQPEIVMNYEVGAKTTWRFDDAWARINVAAFYENYSNIQRTLNRITPVGVSLITIVNAAKATIKGGEAEFTVSPMPGLEGTFNWAYLHPKYQSFIGPGNQILTPAGFAASPKNTFSGDIQYHRDIENMGRITATFSGYHQDGMWALEGASNYNPTTGQHSAHDRIPGYTIFKGRLELSDIKDRNLSVALYADNIFNKKYFTGLVDIYSTLGFTIETLGEPRTYGVEVKYGF